MEPSNAMLVKQVQESDKILQVPAENLANHEIHEIHEVDNLVRNTKVLKKNLSWTHTTEEMNMINQKLNLQLSRSNPMVLDTPQTQIKCLSAPSKLKLATSQLFPLNLPEKPASAGALAPLAKAISTTSTLMQNTPTHNANPVPYRDKRNPFYWIRCIFNHCKVPGVFKFCLESTSLSSQFVIQSRFIGFYWLYRRFEMQVQTLKATEWWNLLINYNFLTLHTLLHKMLYKCLRKSLNLKFYIWRHLSSLFLII